ncbi:spore coat protein [Bacillus sp. PS06]|uniref:spore coat protein n=1 Tax=Bacillus sp. PS06 TaxID=2764176 RepID=UPI0017829218|nr:spore coat protein [Bacillus sp. PS06]MBD8067494.1 spore coat protein [Bacillus sp. PS06]
MSNGNVSPFGGGFASDDTVLQGMNQINKTSQQSFESIHIIDSCDIEVETTDTQVAVSLQAALQVAIAIVISLTIADDAQAEAVTQQLLQGTKTKQANKQKLVIEGSKNIRVQTTDTDVAISLQVLLQILLALVVQIDIL